jgi:hypothetical protein
MNMHRIVSNRDRPAATNTGNPNPKFSESTPPIAGPKTNPRENATLIRPMPLVLSSGGVTSDIAASAAEILAANTPANARARIRSNMDFMIPENTRASTKKERKLPVRLIIRIGLRPYLSESEPQTGENINCISENIPTVNPIIRSLIPSSLKENDGSKGMTIPNPSRSMKTVRNIIASAELFFKIKIN